VDGSHSSGYASRILSPNSKTPFGLSSLDISISCSGSGEINFHSDSIVHMPEPSTVAMAFVGIPLLILGLARKLKRPAKIAAEEYLCHVPRTWLRQPRGSPEAPRGFLSFPLERNQTGTTSFP